MTFNDEWRKDRERKRLERDMKQFQRAMSTPIARGEVLSLGEAQLQHIASIALAIEALEDILIGAGLLHPDQLLDTMQIMAKAKAEQMKEQAEAQQASSIIAPV